MRDNQIVVYLEEEEDSIIPNTPELLAFIPKDKIIDSLSQTEEAIKQWRSYELNFKYDSKPKENPELTY